jgi:hypothetical protein
VEKRDPFPLEEAARMSNSNMVGTPWKNVIRSRSRRLRAEAASNRSWSTMVAPWATAPAKTEAPNE